MSISRVLQVGCCALLSASMCWAGTGAPVPVSPGTSTGARIGDPCPTFSWGAVPAAKSYELVVYRLEDQGEEAEPVFTQRIAGSANGWTPSLDRCLERGRSYAWSVRAMGAKEEFEWSQPNLFEVASGPSQVELQAAVEVVQAYFAARKEEAAQTASSAESPKVGESVSAESPGGAAAPAATQLSVEGNINATSFTGDGENLAGVATDAELGVHDHLGDDGATVLHSSLGSVGPDDHHTLPTTLPPTGPAGGDLAGAYPNPTVGPSAVGSTEITDNSVAEGDLAFDPATQTELDALRARTETLIAWAQYCPGEVGFRYFDQGDGTVVDCATGLIWLKDASCAELAGTDAEGRGNWATAEAAAAALEGGTCGLTDSSRPGDWRQPTVSEYCSAWAGASLSPCPASAASDSLLDSSLPGYPKVVNAKGDATWSEGDAFVGLVPDNYWSATCCFGPSPWLGNLGTGAVFPTNAAAELYVWPVRTGR